jgi:nucleotide-binding universal stress UspA family protein
MDDFKTRLICSGILKGVESRFSVRPGGIASEVEQLARDEHIDLIVVGTKCRQGISRLVFGSVSERIYRRTQQPVLTVNVNTRRPRLKVGRLDHVLLATDLRGPSNLGLSYAASVAAQFNATLSMIHVVRSLRTESSDLQRAQASMRASLLRLGAPGSEGAFEPVRLVQCGDVAERILEIANSLCPNLIVMGLNRRTPALTERFARSVASRIISDVGCPVLTVTR